MLQRVPRITQDELNAAMEEARRDFGDDSDPRPPGAHTIEEWAEMAGIGITTMRTRMRKKVADKKYERIVIRAKGTTGIVHPIPLYRKVKQASNAQVDRIR